MDVARQYDMFPATSQAGLERVRQIEEAVLQAPQLDVPTEHFLHGGMYARTICIPAGVVLTGALVKIPTMLIVSGKASILIGEDEVVIEGSMVVPASAGRKQAFIAHTDTYITMCFRTDAKTVEDAEREFTDEADMLMSRSGTNTTVVTGE
jgi:hypothetical protein